MRRSVFAFGILVLSAAIAAAATSMTTQDLSLQIDPNASVTVPGSITLTTNGTIFNAYVAGLTVSYRARTGSAAGSISVQATSDFSPTNGPSLASGALAFTCSGATLGTGCSGAQAVSATSSRPVVSLPVGACTGGGGACSFADPNTVQLNFSLSNNPIYKTGIYTIHLTFSISSI
jgi:hypothetical protein